MPDGCKGLLDSNCLVLSPLLDLLRSAEARWRPCGPTLRQGEEPPAELLLSARTPSAAQSAALALSRLRPLPSPPATSLPCLGGICLALTAPPVPLRPDRPAHT